MKRILTGIALLLCAIAGHAQTTQITANNIAYFGGAPLTGKFCVTPTDQNGNATPLVTPTGQQLATPRAPLCFPISNGVLSGTAVVPDVSRVQPVNACFRLTISNSFNVEIANYPCIQPQGATWSFDAYVPSSLPATPALTLPQFQTNGVTNPTQGTLNIVGPAVSYGAGGVVNIGGAGASNSNENLAFSATPTFSIIKTSSHIVLSGNITTFTLAAGSDGQHKCLAFAHDGTTTQYTVAAPANVVGFFSVNATTQGANKRFQQCFTYYTADSAWEAESAGILNQ